MSKQNKYIEIQKEQINSNYLEPLANNIETQIPSRTSAPQAHQHDSHILQIHQATPQSSVPNYYDGGLIYYEQERNYEDRYLPKQYLPPSVVYKYIPYMYPSLPQNSSSYLRTVGDQQQDDDNACCSCTII